MDNTVNDRLKEIRLYLKKNQKEMAKALNVQPSYYSEVENGKRGITSKIVESLHIKFDISTDWIYSGNGEMINEKQGIPPMYLISQGNRTSIEKVFKNLAEVKRLEKQFETVIRSHKEFAEFYKAVMEIALFKEALGEIFDKYLSVWVELPIKSEGDVKYMVSVLSDSMKNIKPYQTAFLNLAKAIKDFNFEMYNEGANEFEYTQHQM